MAAVENSRHNKTAFLTGLLNRVPALAGVKAGKLQFEVGSVAVFIF